MPADELLTVHGRPAVRLVRHLNHPVAKVWQAVTTAEHLAAWFPATVDVDLRVGGTVRFTQGGTEQHGTVTDLEPPRLFAFTWSTDHIRIELRPAGEGTVLIFTHTFDDHAGAASFGVGWKACLAALGPVLAGEPPRPSGSMAAQHEELVRQFGLDRPRVTESAGRWTLRFERQLTCPITVAWNHFRGGALPPAPSVGEVLFTAPGVVLGTVTAVDSPRLLAFDVAPDEPGDQVRLELADGTGHGARLVLTITGSSPSQDQLQAAEQRWGPETVEKVAAEALAWAEDHASG